MFDLKSSVLFTKQPLSIDSLGTVESRIYHADERATQQMNQINKANWIVNRIF